MKTIEIVILALSIYIIPMYIIQVHKKAKTNIPA